MPCWPSHQEIGYTQQIPRGFPGGASGKEPTCQCRRHGFDDDQIHDQKDPLEEGMATHSSILAWRIPMDRGAWRATVHWVAKSQT